MKRLLFLSLLFVGSLLNNGFINRNEPDIKGIICGSELYMKVLRKNFSLGDIYTGEPQEEIALEFGVHFSEEHQRIYDYESEKIENYLSWSYIDINQLYIYKIDKEASNNFVTYMIPLPNKKYLGEDSYFETSLRRSGNLIILNYNLYELDDIDESWVLKDNHKATLDLSKLTMSYERFDEKVVDNCLFFPLPGIIEVKN